MKKRSIFYYAGKHKIVIAFSWIFSALSSLLSLVPYYYIWKVISDVFKYYPNFSEATNLKHYGIMAVVFSIISIFVYILSLFLSHVSAFKIATNMRSMSLHHLINLPLGYFTNNSSGKLRRTIDESASRTEEFLAHIMPDCVGTVFTLIGVIVVLFKIDWKLGLISLIPIFISMIFMGSMMGEKLMKTMEEYQNALDDMNSQAVEYVRGIPVVKTFQQSIFSFKNFYNSIQRYKEWAVNYTLSVRIPMCSAMVCVNAGTIFLLVAAILLIGVAVDYQRFLVNFIFYIIFTPICATALGKIMKVSENLMTAQDAQKRIESILNEQSLVESDNPQKPVDNSIEFKDVFFKYEKDGKNIINGVSFKIPAGNTVAIVGHSGSGKTTIASLIPRFWDVESGSVSIGNVDVRSISNSDLMDKVSFVFQDNHIFKTTILENVKMAKPNATNEEVISALENAMCMDIVNKFPDGLNTVIGSKGVYLSGGEVQRITLARAILKDAPIVILDEATAFADPENEHQIQKALEKLIKGKTVLMIAHRLSTICNADNIIVMEKGSICESGTHNELLAKNGVYSSMWKEYQSAIDWKF